MSTNKQSNNNIWDGSTEKDRWQIYNHLSDQVHDGMEDWHNTGQRQRFVRAGRSIKDEIWHQNGKEMDYNHRRVKAFVDETPRLGGTHGTNTAPYDQNWKDAYDAIHKVLEVRPQGGGGIGDSGGSSGGLGGSGGVDRGGHIRDSRSHNFQMEASAGSFSMENNYNAYEFSTFFNQNIAGNYPGAPPLPFIGVPRPGSAAATARSYPASAPAPDPYWTYGGARQCPECKQSNGVHEIMCQFRPSQHTQRNLPAASAPASHWSYGGASRCPECKESTGMHVITCQYRPSQHASHSNSYQTAPSTQASYSSPAQPSASHWEYGGASRCPECKETTGMHVITCQFRPSQHASHSYSRQTAQPSALYWATYGGASRCPECKESTGMHVITCQFRPRF